MDNMPLIFKNEIISQHYKTLVDYINNHQDDFGKLDGSYWGGRTIYIDKIKDQSIINILKDHKYELLNKFYHLSGTHKPVYIDSLHLVRWVEGYELKPHADGENPNGVKHEFWWRDFGTVTFLNDDFEGGDLYLPNQNITIKAQPGYSAIFPGTLEYLHGVSPITKGVRYTIASFLTYDQNYEFKAL